MILINVELTKRDEERVSKFLNNLGLRYTTHKIKKSFTVEEIRDIVSK